MMLLIADHLRLQGLQRESAYLLLAWQLGVRPTDGLRLIAADLQPPSRFGAERPIGVVLLGRARGTKTRRQAYTRVYPNDEATLHFIHVFKTCTPSLDRLVRWSRSPQVTSVIRRACEQLGIMSDFTAHSMRAGWATARHLAGQPIPELLCDGTWSCEATLRVYLDVVAGPNALADHRIQYYMPRIRDLQLRYPQLWSFIPPPPLQPPRVRERY